MKHVGIKKSSAVFLDVLLFDVIEIRVSEGLFHWDSAGWVELDHLQEEVNAELIETFEVGVEVGWFELGEGGLEIGEIVYV